MANNNENPWREITITDWNHFEKEVYKLSYREWLYRGQSDTAWGLKTSLYRLFEDIQKIIKLHKGRVRRFAKDEHERLLIERFKANAHLYLNSLPEDNGNRSRVLTFPQEAGRGCPIIVV